MSGSDISMLIVGLTNNFRAFKHRNFVWILLAVPLLLLAAVAVFLVAMPQMGQAQDTDTAPAAPSGLTAIPGDTEAMLTWDDPGDSSITGYEYLLQAQVAKLTSSGWGPDDQFGYSVAVDGDTVVVGAHKDDDKGSNSGSAYVFTKTDDGWTTVKLTASDGAAGDEFGISVAVDGDTVVVGAHKDDDKGSNSGSAYVFTKPSGGWGDWDDLPQTHEEDEDKDALTAKLTASDGAANHEFGISVAVDGDTVVVGAHKDDDEGSNSGSAYVFTKPSGGWGDWDDLPQTHEEDEDKDALTAKLTASDGAADDEFGISVAVDGDTVVVGAHKVDASNTVANSGSAFLFTKPATGWANATQTAKLTASDGAADDEFGISVAVDGDTVVVGALYDDASNTVTNSGSAYAFTKPDDGWNDDQYDGTETAKLTASDGAGGDQLGISIAVDGDTVVVGAHKDDDKGTYSGSAYVFTKPARGWADARQTAKLTASDGAADDEFGISVAVDGDTVVVGAHYDDFNGGNFGSAYVNEVSDWTAIPDSAHNSDPVGTNTTSYTVTGLTNGIPYSFKLRAVNDVGPSAASDTVTSPPAQPTGLTATVKSTQVTLGWDAPSDPSDASITEYEYLQAQTSKLTASDGAAGDLFGHSVAVDGDTAVVGAYEDESGKGAAYVLAKDSSSGAWSQVAKLTASDAAVDDNFGWSVGVNGNTVVVGAHFDNDKGGDSGSAYVFTKPSGGWADWDNLTQTHDEDDEEDKDALTAKLTASDGVGGEWFGESVAVDGDTVVVGASEDDNKGSAYVFTKPSGGWADWSTSTDTEKAGLTAKLTASDVDEFDEFGKSVSVDGGTLVVGAPRNDGYGSAYVFTKPVTGWTATSTAAKLTPGDTGNLGDSQSGTFGASVAVDGDTVVVGASGYSGSQGRAYAFTKPSGGWATTTEAAELATSDAEKNQFGWSVAVDGNTVVVGAHTDDASESVTGSGSAYLFTKATNSVWADATETVKLTAADGAGEDQFGWSIAAGGGTVVVGAHFDDASDTVADSGSAYIYGVSGWTAIPDSAAGATSYTVNVLINDEEYGFWIRARNTVGTSEASDPVTATPVNTAPTAVDDTATMYEDTVLTIVVTANDSDDDPIDTLSVTVLTTPGNGTAVLASGSTTTVTYTPDANYNGSDSFVYTVSDGTATATATVTITITAVNDAPTAVDDSTSTAEDTAVDINVVANDTDPDTVDTLSVTTVTTTPGNGTAAINSGSTTTVTYTPNADFNGIDSFDYTLSDGTATDTGTVTITITAVNDPPTALADSATTTQGTAVDINVVANDTDVEGDALSVTSVTTPSKGTAAIDMNNTAVVTYTPNSGHIGTDSFKYTLDGAATDTGTVTITVAATSALPAKPTGLTASAGLGQITLNWTDPFDGSITKYEYSQSSSDSDLVWTDIPDSANGGTNGSSFMVTGLTNGTTYSFAIRATNSEDTSDATVPVTATPGNAAPTFDDDSPTSRSVEENSEQGANVGDPVAATDPEGDMLTYSLSNAGTDADSFSIDVNGQITVASGANLEYEGAKSSYSVTVSVHDGKNVQDGDDDTIDATIGVTIEVGNVDEAPTKPTGLTAARGNARVTLRWEDDPYDRPITGRQYLSERQVAKLTAGDGAENDYFGYSLAVDGDTAVVGAYGEDNNKGAAYVLVRQSGSWSQVAKLTALDGQGGHWFGASVAVDGDTVVVGAFLGDGGGDGGVDNAGAAYVFTKSGTEWDDATETAKLTASDGADLDAFGGSVAMNGDTVVVGAYWDDDNGDDSGSVYVFTKATDSVWADATETVKLTASDGLGGDYFGVSVALDADTMAVGAPQDDGSGSVYVFTRQAGVWSEVAKLTASDGAADHEFGISVAVDGDAVDGDTVVVGAHQDDVSDANNNQLSNAGSAYVFAEPASGVWDDATETAKLTASDGAADDEFGRSVGIDGNTVVVGAPQTDDVDDNNMSVSDSGSAYVFTKPGAGWATATETAKLTAYNGAADDEFGGSVGIFEYTDGYTVVVGAYNDDHVDGNGDTVLNSGSAYVYEVSGWTTIPNSEADGTNAILFTVTNLTNDAKYDFRIRAVNEHGESDASDAATVVPIAPMPTPTVPIPAPTPDHEDSNTTHNTPPIAVYDARTTSAGTAVDIDVVANDTDLEGDTLRVISVTTPSNGTAVINWRTNSVTYIPNPGFHGADSFNYTVFDGFNTITGTVTITVAPPNRAPEVVRSIASVKLTVAGEAVLVEVAGTFKDEDGDLLTYSALSLDTSVATVEVLGGTVTITPVAAGSTTIEITASDPHGERTTHSAPVTVRAAPDPTPAPQPTPTPQPRPTATPTRMPTPEPTSTPVPAPIPSMTLPPSLRPTNRPVPTATPRTEATATSTPAPTLTPGPAGTVAPTLEPVATPTTIPTATSMFTPRPDRTSTPVAIGGRETAPTPTVQPLQPEADRGGGGFSWWILALTVIVVLAIALALVRERRRRTSN